MGYIIGNTNPSDHGITHDVTSLMLDLEEFLTTGTLPVSATSGTVITPVDNRWTLNQRTGVKLATFSSEVSNSGIMLIKDEESNHTTPWVLDTVAFPGTFNVTYELLEEELPDRLVLTSNASYKHPKDFSLQYSDDGDVGSPTWTTHQSWTGQTISALDTTLTLNTVAAPHRWWRLVVTSLSTTPTTNLFGLVKFQLLRNALYNVTCQPTWFYTLPGLSATLADRSYLNMKIHVLPGSFNNVIFGSATGWIEDTILGSQPGSANILKSSLPLYNNTMPYWIAANGQGFAIYCKCSSVIRGGFAGKFNPYATPLQYPLPFVVGFPLIGAPDVSYDHSLANNNPLLGFTDGLGILSPTNGVKIAGSNLRIWPYDSALGTGAPTVRNLGASVPVNQSAINGVTVTSNNTYTFASSITSMSFVVGMHILVAGFTNSANNGYQEITALTSTTIEVAGTALVIETPPGQISIKVEEFPPMPCIIYHKGSATESAVYGDLDFLYKISASASIASGYEVYVGTTLHVILNFDSSANTYFAIKMG